LIMATHNEAIGVGRNPQSRIGKRTRRADRVVEGFTQYTSVELALETIWHLTKSDLSVETIKAKDSFGRIACEDITSPINFPDKERSHMDGYAVSAADLTGVSISSPKTLSLVTSVDPSFRLSRGETIGIGTGGALPPGADAVVPVEDTEKIGDSVRFTKPVGRGEFCFPIGVDVRKGAVVIRSGNVVRAQDVGMLALLGIRELRVYRKPKVAIIATGDELVDAFDANDPSKVRESHSPIFENLIIEMGGVVSLKEIVGDNIDRMTEAIKRALRDSDLLLTLGGTSLGKADLVEQALGKASTDRRIIHGIRMDRGRVAGVAAVNGKPVVMLPGPVQGAMNAFLLLAVPLLSRMISGAESKSIIGARLSKDWKARNKFRDFTKVLYVRLEREGDEYEASPIVGETESIRVLTDSNGFVVVPEQVTEFRRGEKVEVRLLPGFSYVGGQFLAP
jgi:molybdopterin molybdotransferase